MNDIMDEYLKGKQEKKKKKCWILGFSNIWRLTIQDRIKPVWCYQSESRQNQ